MKYADLHIHSTFSDGNLTPEQILEEAKQKGVKCISITDHDSIDSQYIIKNNNSDVDIIPGIELSTEINRVKSILNKLEDEGIYLNFEDIVKGNSSVGRAHIAHEIVRKGYEDNYKTAFSKYLIKGKRAYEKGEKLSYKEALRVIEDSNGIAVLAHPGKIYKSMEVEKIIKELKCYGLKGIEVYHPSHRKDQINLLHNLSKKYKLLITGGSDLHYTGSKDIFIGSQGINENLLNKLLLCSKNRKK